MKTVITISCMLVISCVSAQSIEPQVIGSMGDHYTSTNAQLSCTAGEVMIETVTSTNSIITQGFHQPDDQGVGIADNNLSKIKVSVFPNPTFDQLNLSIQDQSQDFSVLIFDMNGKQMHSSVYKETSTSVAYDVSEWAAGHYVIKLLSKDNKHSASYKLQKMK